MQKEPENLALPDIQDGFVRKLTHSSSRSISPSAGLNHVHKDDMEITVVLKGSGSYEIAGRPHTILGNSMLIVPPGVEHNSEGNHCYIGEFYYLKLRLRGNNEVLGLNAERSRHLRQTLFSIAQGVYPCSAQPIKLLCSAFEAYAQRNIPYAQALLLSFLYAIAEYTARRQNQTETGFTEQINAYVQDHLDEAISLGDMADAMGYSLSYFKTKFRRIVGMTPNDFINHSKIEEAKRLLREGNNITDTAMALGFNSSNYFSYVFRNYTAMSPKQYVREHLRK